MSSPAAGQLRPPVSAAASAPAPGAAAGRRRALRWWVGRGGPWPPGPRRSRAERSPARARRSSYGGASCRPLSWFVRWFTRWFIRRSRRVLDSLTVPPPTPRPSRRAARASAPAGENTPTCTPGGRASARGAPGAPGTRNESPPAPPPTQRIVHRRATAPPCPPEPAARTVYLAPQPLRTGEEHACAPPCSRAPAAPARSSRTSRSSTRPRAVPPRRAPGCWWRRRCS